MVEDKYLALKLVAALGVHLGADHHHALPDLRPLDLLQREAGRLAALHLRHRHPLPVDRLHSDGGKVSQGIRAKKKGIVETDCASQGCA